MNTKRSIGILLDGGAFDQQLISYISAKITVRVQLLRDAGLPVNRSSLARELGIRRNRCMRLTKALGITHLFD